MVTEEEGLMPEEFTWTTYDGRVLTLSEITDNHLNNILYHQKQYGIRINPMIKIEADYRGITGDTQIPWENENGQLMLWNYQTHRPEIYEGEE